MADDDYITTTTPSPEPGMGMVVKYGPPGDEGSGMGGKGGKSRPWGAGTYVLIDEGAMVGLNDIRR
jgi:hypothetical protein